MIEHSQCRRAVAAARFASAALLASWAAVAGAQGFGLNEIGTCTVGRGQAGTGAPCRDASTIYWNPAAATRLEGWSLSGGAAAIHLTGAFRSDTGRSDEADVPTRVPPSLFVNHMRGRWALGVGAYVPYGLTSQWHDDFPGRFLVRRAQLTTFYVQPNVAFAITPSWSIGGGPVIARSKVELAQSVDLSSQALPGTQGVTFAALGVPVPTEFARVTLEGSDWALGFHAGLHGTIGSRVELGARFLSRLHFDYAATAAFSAVPTGLRLPVALPLPGGALPAGTPVDALLASQFAPGGALAAQDVRSELPHPAQLQAGVGYTGVPRLTVVVDGTWVEWSTFRDLPLAFEGGAGTRTFIEDFRDSWSVRAGVDYALRPRWVVRGGLAFVRTPVPDETVTPLLPDSNRRNFTLGLSAPLGRTIGLDVGYLHVDTPERRGRIVDRPSRSLTAAQLNRGVFALDVNVLSVGLTARFGRP